MRDVGLTAFSHLSAVHDIGDVVRLAQHCSIAVAMDPSMSTDQKSHRIVAPSGSDSLESHPVCDVFDVP